MVVQEKYAYVTLRNGVTCRPSNTFSSLDVVDISNPASPIMVHSQPMKSPYGLGVSGNKLFVCEGSNGLKVLDISNPALPIMKHTFEDLPAYGVIVRDKHLIVTGEKGLFQYNFDDSDDVQFLGKIPVL